jgi:hypothetical protein
MHPFVSSFIGEIQRLGASLPAQYRDPAFVGAALLGGLNGDMSLDHPARITIEDATLEPAPATPA